MMLVLSSLAAFTAGLGIGSTLGLYRQRRMDREQLAADRQLIVLGLIGVFYGVLVAVG